MNLQSELDSKNFEIEKCQNIITIHKQRQETLQIEMNDLRKQIIEESLRQKQFQDLYHSQLSKEASVKSGLIKIPSGLRGVSDRSFKKDGSSSSKTYNVTSKKNSSRTYEHQQRHMHSFNFHRAERSRAISFQAHQRGASKAFMEGTEYLRTQIFKSKPSDKSSSHRTEGMKEDEFETLRGEENLVDSNYIPSTGKIKEETPTVSVDRSEIVPTIEESESISSSNSLNSSSRFPKENLVKMNKDKAIILEKKKNSMSPLNPPARISILNLNQNQNEIFNKKNKFNSPKIDSQAIQKLAYVDEFFVNFNHNFVR